MNCDDFISAKLIGKLWHVTRPDLYDDILADGFIRPEPDIPAAVRYGGSRGISFVRLIGGFSIFDFPTGFDIAQYRRDCPISSLEALIPYDRDRCEAVWIEIDATACGGAILRGPAATERWKVEEAYRHRIMPYVEGAHVGDMPVSNIAGAYLYRCGDADWHRIG